jgi:hypothetical protein
VLSLFFDCLSKSVFHGEKITVLFCLFACLFVYLPVVGSQSDFKSIETLEFDANVINKNSVSNTGTANF